MGAWIVGHNLAGYLPESDVLAFDSREDALSAFVDEMRYHASTDDDMALGDMPADAFDDDYPTMLAQAEAVIRDEIAPGTITGDFGVILTDSQDRPISFWLQWSEESEADDE